MLDTASTVTYTNMYYIDGYNIDTYMHKYSVYIYIYICIYVYIYIYIYIC